MNGLPDAATDALVETRVVDAGEDEDAGADGDSVVLLGDELVSDELATELLVEDELELDELELELPPPQPASARAAIHRTAAPRGTVAIVTVG